MLEATSKSRLLPCVLLCACAQAPLPPAAPPPVEAVADGVVREVCPNYLEAMRGMRFPAGEVPPEVVGGWVTVEFVVTPDRRIGEVRIASASHAAFARLARAWVGRLECDSGGRTVRLSMPFMFEGGSNR